MRTPATMSRSPLPNISENFSLKEFERTSHTDLQEKNRIKDPAIRAAVTELVLEVLQPLRTAWGKPLVINSGYRCPELNARLPKASATSQHMKGEAADVAADDPLALATKTAKLLLPFDQMILYNTFVHISHKKGGPQRYQILYSSDYKGDKVRL